MTMIAALSMLFLFIFTHVLGLKKVELIQYFYKGGTTVEVFAQFMNKLVE